MQLLLSLQYLQPTSKQRKQSWNILLGALQQQETF